MWSLAFVIVMITAYATMISWSNDATTLRLISMGTLLSAPTLLWSGLRTQRGARGHEWLAAVGASLALVA